MRTGLARTASRVWVAAHAAAGAGRTAPIQGRAGGLPEVRPIRHGQSHVDEYNGTERNRVASVGRDQFRMAQAGHGVSGQLSRIGLVLASGGNAGLQAAAALRGACWLR